MEQSPQNPGVPAQASTMQGSPLPANTAQNNAAESTTVETSAVPTATALQSPAQDPAVDGAASAASAEAVAPAPAEPKRMGLYSLICLPTGGFTAFFIQILPTSGCTTPIGNLPR